VSKLTDKIEALMRLEPPYSHGLYVLKSILADVQDVLQDKEDAYQRGFEAGLQQAVGTAAFESARANAAEQGVQAAKAEAKIEAYEHALQLLGDDGHAGAMVAIAEAVDACRGEVDNDPQP
jgi:hypothetical protein